MMAHFCKRIRQSVRDENNPTGCHLLMDENGLAKKQWEVESLVNYLKGMETQFRKVLQELKEVPAMQLINWERQIWL